MAKVSDPYLYRIDGRPHLLRTRAKARVSHLDTLAQRCIFFRPGYLENPHYDAARRRYQRDQGLRAESWDTRVETLDLETQIITSHSIAPLESSPIYSADRVHRYVLKDSVRHLLDDHSETITRPSAARTIGFRLPEFQVWLIKDRVVEWSASQHPCEVLFDAGGEIQRLIPVHDAPGHWIASTTTRSFLWDTQTIREILVHDASVPNCSILGDQCAAVIADDIILTTHTLSEPLPVSIQPHGSSLATLARSFTDALARWSVQGWPTVDQEVYEHRLATCRACPYWREDQVFAMARCNACGCSGLKHVLATESCPKGKWTSDLLGRSLDGVFPWYRGGEILCSTDVMILDVDIPRHETEATLLSRLESFVLTHPAYGFRAYRTAKGLRYILTSHLHPIVQFAPLSDLAAALGADQQYLSLARKYGCYAARLTPKRSRVPAGQSIDDLAVCAFRGHYGSTTTDPRCQKLVTLHDKRTSAQSGKPLA